MRRPKGRSSGYQPEFVYVLAHPDRERGEYLCGCRHANCPTWVGLSSKCVRYWLRRGIAERWAEALKVRGLYPGGPSVLVTVEEVAYRRIGKAPEGRPA